MTTADLIKNIRQRCGDVNAISPAAEPLLTSIIEGVAVEALTAGKNQADQGPLAQAAVLRDALAKVLTCKDCNGEGMVYMTLDGHVVGELCDCRMLAQDALDNTGAAGQCLLDELDDQSDELEALRTFRREAMREQIRMAAEVARLRQELTAARGER
jgi:hypothetical protein